MGDDDLIAPDDGQKDRSWREYTIFDLFLYDGRGTGESCFNGLHVPFSYGEERHHPVASLHLFLKNRSVPSMYQYSEDEEEGLPVFIMGKILWRQNEDESQDGTED